MKPRERQREDAERQNQSYCHCQAPKPPLANIYFSDRGQSPIVARPSLRFVIHSVLTPSSSACNPFLNVTFAPLMVVAPWGTNCWLPSVTTFYYGLAIATVHVPT
jgi:hypothetical protein